MRFDATLIKKSVRTGGVALILLSGLLMLDDTLAATPAVSHSMSNATQGTQMNRFGGPVYDGAPALPVTVALVMAGGGPKHFSLVTALNNMLGKKTVKAEVRKLIGQYGKRRVNDWVKGIDFAVADTLKIAKAKHIDLPAPAKLSGVELAKTLVQAGTGPDRTFWAGYLFDHALSHGIHEQVMIDTDAKFNAPYDANYHAITNQAFYDVAHALGDTSVKLAAFH